MINNDGPKILIVSNLDLVFAINAINVETFLKNMAISRVPQPSDQNNHRHRSIQQRNEILMRHFPSTSFSSSFPAPAAIAHRS